MFFSPVQKKEWTQPSHLEQVNLGKVMALLLEGTILKITT